MLASGLLEATGEPEGRRSPARGALPVRARRRCDIAAAGPAAERRRSGRDHEVRLRPAPARRRERARAASGGQARELVRAGRGLAFLFLPHAACVAEVRGRPGDPVVFHGRTADFQDVAAQGVLTLRVADPGCSQNASTSRRLRDGPLAPPTAREAGAPLRAARGAARGGLGRADAGAAGLAEGPERIRAAVAGRLAGGPALPAMGLEVVSVRVSSVRPRRSSRGARGAHAGRIQQAADEAAFSRRALAVEKERASGRTSSRTGSSSPGARRSSSGSRGRTAGVRRRRKRRRSGYAAEAKAARSGIDAGAAAARTRAEADAAAHRVRTAGEGRGAPDPGSRARRRRRRSTSPRRSGARPSAPGWRRCGRCRRR